MYEFGSSLGVVLVVLKTPLGTAGKRVPNYTPSKLLDPFTIRSPVLDFGYELPLGRGVPNY